VWLAGIVVRAALDL